MNEAANIARGGSNVRVSKHLEAQIKGQIAKGQQEREEEKHVNVISAEDSEAHGQP